MRHRRSNVLIAYLSPTDLLWYICFVMRVPSPGVLTTYPAKKIQLNTPHWLLSRSIGFASFYFAMLPPTDSSPLICHVMPHSHDVNPGPTANELLVCGLWVFGLVVVCPHEGKQQQYNMN